MKALSPDGPGTQGADLPPLFHITHDVVHSRSRVRNEKQQCVCSRLYYCTRCMSRLAFSVSCFQSSLFLVAEVTGFPCEIPWHGLLNSEFCHILELASIES